MNKILRVLHIHVVKPVDEGEHVLRGEGHSEPGLPRRVAIVDLVCTDKGLVWIFGNLGPFFNENPEVGGIADDELLHHLGLEHSSS